jgi:PPK2 family polyphosphate:nucleotide phosphotransferase
MPSREIYLGQFRVPHNKTIRLRDRDPAWAGDPDLPKRERRRVAEEFLTQEVTELSTVQDLLYASDSWSVLVILQAMDAAGKDGTIKHVMSGVNPQGCQVYSFKQPSAEELDHTFLWRYMKRLPERGRIGIFNRSYYEDVLVVKVHPELIDCGKIPGADPSSEDFWRRRYDDINEMEKHLTRNGTLVLKFFLHMSKEEQRRRFLKRLKDPQKNWKFSPADMAERGHWDDYQQVIEDMLNATSTKHAPWHVIPADHKWVARALVSTIIAQGVQGLNLRYPEVSPERKQQLLEIERELEAEGRPNESAQGSDSSEDEPTLAADSAETHPENASVRPKPRKAKRKKRRSHDADNGKGKASAKSSQELPLTEE